MKKYFVLFALISLGCQSQNSNKKNKNSSHTKYKIEKTDAQWKNELSSIQYYVLRQAGTERAFSGEYDKNYNSGIYVCAACQSPLYESRYKYDSKSGWPSFDRGIRKNIEFDVDYKLGYPRSELKCSSCGGHLGHLFNDGPRNTTGERHCINSAALNFIPNK
ncbi:peptide-methionine (R)-S-oxide reductase MsrB [Flavobacteriaceae bacterium]|nr:peptide-methionine (R)-S-oxide reductase MsrB [Flavobacteriaceae bacterium]